MSRASAIRAMATASDVIMQVPTVKSARWAQWMVFDNKSINTLRVDDSTEKEPRRVVGAHLARVAPTPLKEPVLVAYSSAAMDLIGVTVPDEKDAEEYRSFVDVFSGNAKLEKSETYSQCYCGHQFGHFAGQLGDGRAINLGEVHQEGSGRWELQLKGAGLTPFARSADGRAALRSSIREFLCSEAMAALGVPTTRAGTLTTSSTMIMRDMFYSGNPMEEKASVVLRISPSFFRFGSFEICKSTDAITGEKGPSVGKEEMISELLDHITKTFFPHIHNSSPDDRTARARGFLQEVSISTAALLAKWQTVGFCHGVLNTDNMSVHGVTIDYGPFGFMDFFDKGYICNTTDEGGRYSYENQPPICKWNLKKLVEALAPILPTNEGVAIVDNHYDSTFTREYFQIMRKKLGIMTEMDGDEQLIDEMLAVMNDTRGDFTLSFRYLSSAALELNAEGMPSLRFGSTINQLLSVCAPKESLARLERPSMSLPQIQSLAQIAQQQPQILPMFGLSVERVQKEVQKLEKVKAIMEESEEAIADSMKRHWEAFLSGPYQDMMLKSYFQFCEQRGLLPNAGESIAAFNKERQSLMNSVNPKFILRNWLAQRVIEQAERGDYDAVRTLQQVLRRPFDEQPLFEEYARPPPSSYIRKGVSQLSCSS